MFFTIGEDITICADNNKCQKSQNKTKLSTDFNIREKNRQKKWG